ncbi:MAG: DUF1192 domain-containing protein [Alphaproteobacteria bacterium]|nr:DUF1192 domain-containing protein [Alphaproteobacteria bacterium]
MDTDDIAPPPKKTAKVNLELLGIAELEAHIAALEEQIVEAKAMIAKKQGARNAAASFFKS